MLKKKTLGIFLSLILFIGIFAFNLSDMPFRYEPNRQKNQIESISNFVLTKTDQKPYNFALLTPGNSDHGYRYYFDISGHPPVRIDNLINDPKRTSVTDQLLIVCEDIKCNPLGNPLFDVAGFGVASVSGVWDFSHVKVYRLIHSQK